MRLLKCKLRYSACFLALVVSGACRSPSSKPTTQLAEPMVAASAVADELPQDFYLHLSVESSRWNPTSYTLDIDREGNMVYRGRKGVAVRGTAIAKLSKQDVLAIANILEAGDFFREYEEYMVFTSHGFERTLLACSNGRQREVSFYWYREVKTESWRELGSSTALLSQIEDDIENLAGVSRWVTAAEPRPTLRNGARQSDGRLDTLVIDSDTKEPAILFLYAQDDGMSSRLPGAKAVGVSGNPLIFAAWQDGRIVWSRDQIGGGPPYFTAKNDPSEVLQIAASVCSLLQASWGKSHFGPDSSYTMLSVCCDAKLCSVGTWHPLVEANPNLVVTDFGVQLLNGRSRDDMHDDSAPEYKDFRANWEAATRLIAALVDRAPDPTPDPRVSFVQGKGCGR